MKMSDAKKFTILEVERYIKKAKQSVVSWEKNLKEWEEILELLTK